MSFIITRILALSIVCSPPLFILSLILIHSINEKVRARNLEFITSPVGRRIQAAHLEDFVNNYQEVGLSVTAWKKRWKNQPAIENVLDWLSHEKVVSERSPGVASSWIETPDQEMLMEIFFNRGRS